MSSKITLIIFLASAMLLSETPFFFAEENLPYTIGPGDVLEISIWQHPELDRIVTVRPDGRMSFSLIGDVNTNGLTPAELDELITRRLSEYVQKPEVTVIVTGIKSNQVLVLGQVTRPGAYPMEESLTALEAVAIAGGYTDRAGLSKVTITRQSRERSPKVIKVDLQKVISEGARSGNITLEPGDVVHVPKRTSIWTIFDRYFIGGILPVMAFAVMIDTISRR
ncbi:MAG: polysaccharide biosynthesis/export family protein [Elusimicrobiota bacterium]|nr:polysaccharide biosynthesis/export family protein [Elusimicrobiota bacterium]MDH5662248.1 polysaccharide biosynthesis/export family protein [Elusimicrobiota bacterium]